MVKESNYKIFQSEKKSNNGILVKTSKNNIIKTYYLYLSINRFVIDTKDFYKIDYVLNNNRIDLIPDKNIFNSNEIKSIYTITFNNNQIYVFNTPNIKLFSYLDLFDYKVKTTIIEIEPNESLLKKFFNQKKLFIKNDNFQIEQVKIKNNLDIQLEDLTDIFLEKLLIE